MFRVVAIHNYASEAVSDVSVCVLRTKERAQLVADMINEDAGPRPYYWHIVRAASEKLHRFEP